MSTAGLTFTRSLASRLWLDYLHTEREQRRQSLAQARAEAGYAGLKKRWQKRRVEKNLHIAERLARQLAPKFARHIPLSDLISAGHVGLCKATERYDYRKGKFEAYAWFVVKGAIVDAHKRRAYREEIHDSTDAITERLGFAPAALVVDHAPLPDELAERSEAERAVAMLLAELPPLARSLMQNVMAGMSVTQAALAVGRSPAWGRATLVEARDRIGAGMVLR